MDVLGSFFSGLLNSEPNAIIQALIVLLLLIYIDVGTAVAMAVRRHTFDYRALLDFMFTMILPYLLGYGVIQSALYAAVRFNVAEDAALAPFQVISVALYAGMVGLILKSTYDNLRGIDPSLVPDEADQ